MRNLETTISYLQESVAPRAAILDRDRSALQQALAGLGDRGLMALQVTGCQEEFRHCQEAIARYSGALAFLQTQHQSAAAMLANSPNELLKQEYLPSLADGSRLLGVGFSHLRRDPSPVRAVSTNGSYTIDGEVPWVTGWGFFSEFIVGAALPDGQSVFGLVPLSDTDGDTGGNITLSSPMQLAAMNSTQTVTARLHRWFLPQTKVVMLKPKGWMDEQSQKNVLNHSFAALGCARAGLDIVLEVARKQQQPFVFEAFAALDRELTIAREAIFAAQFRPDCNSESPITLRATAIELAVRCAHAAIVASGGSANLSSHPAERIYREALVYTVSGQTQAVMAATLARLSTDRKGKVYV
ncbi:MAG: acyl-CoA dehydrogenase family protein [Geitlerinemataceae cyanobacterium]